MHDDDLTPLHELASSHLDGDNSAEERARVAASAELQSLVTSFEDVRARLADVPPAPAAARDAAFAAALAAFDELHGESDADSDSAAVARPAAPVVSLDSRRRWSQRVMGIAAAVAAVGVIGIGVSQMGGSDKDSSSADADTAAKTEFNVQTESADSAPMDAMPMSTIGTITGAGSVALQVNSPEELAALPLPAGDDAVATAGGAPETTTSPDATSAASETTMAVAPPSSRIGESPNAYSSLPGIVCLTGNQVFLADVYFQGQLAVAARDTVTGVTYAYAADCTVLASVAP
jgi:negative regulator of sigma E activity